MYLDAEAYHLFLEARAVPAKRISRSISSSALTAEAVKDRDLLAIIGPIPATCRCRVRDSRRASYSVFVPITSALVMSSRYSKSCGSVIFSSAPRSLIPSPSSPSSRR